MNPGKSAGALLGIGDEPAIVAVVGCDGKTTFIESLARECCDKKVLVTPTTKIFPMAGHSVAGSHSMAGGHSVVLRSTLAECEAHSPVSGIQCLGIKNAATGKLEALPPQLLAEIVPQYDVVLLEADGSRGLPCKGWRANEPVVPVFCTHTVGILTLNALGKPADERYVLNLAEFCALTGLQRGEAIHLHALERMLCAERGMFRNAAGRQCLLLNQAEDENAAPAAAWARDLRRKMPQRFFRLAYGSAGKNDWTEESGEK